MSTSIGERILLRLSRPTDAPDPELAGTEWTVDNALDSLRSNIPGFDTMCRGRSVLDFGCGYGYQAVALALGGADRVVGVDINRKALTAARALAESRCVADRVDFATARDPSRHGLFDIVISQNSMEHFPDPVGVLLEMKSALRPDGRIIIVFSPPWYAPYGSHMHFFTRVPWVHLVFSERTVMRVRSRYRDDGAERYEEVEFGLNRMSVARFERLVREAGLSFESRSYRCLKALDALAAIPAVRELAINSVAAVLVPDGAARGDRGP